MITLEQILTAGGHRIASGSDYLWNCYGPNARYIDLNDVAGSEYLSIIFDCKNYKVYDIMICVPGQEQAFRWYDPEFREAYVAECKTKSVAPDEAWAGLIYEDVTPDTILAYAKDVGELYYDDLPIPAIPY
jgi:hypothetical protein